MDTAKLTVMLETIRLGSIRKAAKRLGYTQAGLIYLLNKLEEEIGFPILERNSNGVYFNEKGHELQPYFNALLAANSSMQARMAEISDDVRGKVRVGSYPSIVANLLPQIILQFKEQNPNIDIELTVGVPDLAEKVDRGLLDIALAEEGYANGHDWTPVWTDEIYCAVKSDSPLAQYSAIPLTFILKEPIIYPSINMKNLILIKLSELGESINLKKNITVVTVEGVTVLSMTAAGLGHSFLSNLWTAQCPKGVTMRPISPPFLRNIGIISKPGAEDNPAVRKFINCIKNSSTIGKIKD